MLHKNYPDFGLLLLRVSFAGTMLIAHGWPKLVNFTTYMAKFPDPLGVGSQFSLAMAVFSEVFCSLFVIAGYKTRWFSVPLIITMVVAVFIVHAADPFKKMELGLMYMFGFTTLFLTGGGALSLDRGRP